MKRINYILSLLMFLFMATACEKNDDESGKFPIGDKTPVVEDLSGFAKGADVSWLTEMENSGIQFFDTTGTEMECMSLLKSMGMNSIRLRVWVNPEDGWCNKSDLIIKAKRAAELNMRIMVDFHYSDSWADPGQQTKPAAWTDYSFEELKIAVAEHTTEVLTTLKEWNITPEWVQIGNETGNGMLWDDGLIAWGTTSLADSYEQYAILHNAGYDAAKVVFPEAKVVVHLQDGHRIALFTSIFDQLKKHGEKWDVIGMSVYPDYEENTVLADWQNTGKEVVANINTLIDRYNCEVMICETGITWELDEDAYTFYSKFINDCKAIEKCTGVFYWEPQAHNGWQGYQKGAFNEEGQPTKVLQAFK